MKGVPDWFEHEWMMASTLLPLMLEFFERTALAEGISLLHPLSDPDLVDFLLSLPPEIKVSGGAGKALVRLACPELPPDVLARLDKTDFLGAALAGSPVPDILEAIHRGPRRLPDVDWEELERGLRTSGVEPSHFVTIRFVVSADRFMAAT